MTDSKDDGEKLFSENNTEVKSPEAAKFIPESENKNGISPITVDSVKTTFTGLTKEELMKYANDPFWVRIRWFLFVLFWLIWLCMLFGAILIIAFTPKCDKPSPPSWWQKSPLYVIDVQKLVPKNAASETSVIEILKGRISYLKDLGIESVLLKSVLESMRPGYDEVKNFTNVEQVLGSLGTFHNDIINYAKSKGVNIILSFVPNYSGKNAMFDRSQMKEDGYQDFYVWYPGNYSSKPKELPNNWLSVYDAPAWEWDEKRKQFYLHQFNVTQPDLNYRNPKVVDFISGVLRFWLDQGIKGFHLDKTEYLLESSKFENETGTNTQYNLKQYGFYLHTQTYELEDNIKILSNWSEIIRKSPDRILSVSGGILNMKNISNLVLRPLSLSPNFSATEINKTVSQWKDQVTYPTWEWRCSQSNTSCIPQSAIKGLTVISFLLPGTPIIKLGDELGANVLDSVNHSMEHYLNISKIASSDPFSHFNLVKKLIKMRSENSIASGNFESNVLNKTVYSFTRIDPGNPGYLVAWNIGNNITVVNFKQHFSTVPNELTVEITANPNSNCTNCSFDNSYSDKRLVPSTEIKIPPMAAIVFSMVPNKE